MTPPIRVRRRFHPDDRAVACDNGHRRTDLPWSWVCRPCVWAVQIELRSERTQEAALAAGCAHLATCGYHADDVRRRNRAHLATHQET